MSSDRKASDSYKDRPVRSFVLRTGRLTEGQRRAFDEQWSVYGVDYSPVPLDYKAVFGNEAPVTLEIGFGNGTTLVATAAKFPERNFIGVEVHTPGVGRCMLEAAKLNLQNLRVISHDAIEVLRDQIPDESLDIIDLFFPDPWHKKKHNKRRIVQPDFVAMLSSKLRSGGGFHVATDWSPYAEHITDVMQQQNELKALGEELPWRPDTHFENRGLKLGHPVWEEIYRKV